MESENFLGRVIQVLFVEKNAREMKFLHARTEGFGDGMFFQQKSRENKTENQHKPAIESA